jgi:hypothetical protein
VTTIIKVHDFTTCETEIFTGKGIKECLTGLERAGYDIYEQPNENDGWVGYVAYKDGEMTYEITYKALR